jgi:hypothetical protein
MRSARVIRKHDASGHGQPKTRLPYRLYALIGHPRFSPTVIVRWPKRRRKLRLFSLTVSSPPVRKMSPVVTDNNRRVHFFTCR